jgi:hypothetical protein
MVELEGIKLCACSCTKKSMKDWRTREAVQKPVRRASPKATSFPNGIELDVDDDGVDDKVILLMLVRVLANSRLMNRILLTHATGVSAVK